MGTKELSTTSKLPPPTTAVLTSISRHISSKCSAQNRAFLDCKKAHLNPEKCLNQGHNVMGCVSSLLKQLHETCGKELTGYHKCLDYYGNEFDMCREQQKAFEAVCPE